MIAALQLGRLGSAGCGAAGCRWWSAWCAWPGLRDACRWSAGSWPSLVAQCLWRRRCRPWLPLRHSRLAHAEPRGVAFALICFFAGAGGLDAAGASWHPAADLTPRRLSGARPGCWAPCFGLAARAWWCCWPLSRWSSMLTPAASQSQAWQRLAAARVWLQAMLARPRNPCWPSRCARLVRRRLEIGPATLDIPSFSGTATDSPCAASLA